MSNRSIVAEIVALQRRVRSLEVSPRLAHASLDTAQLPSYDIDGNLMATYGQQPDGSHTVVVVGGPTPLQPTDAICTGGPGFARVAWDGNLIGTFGTVDAELDTYNDFQTCEIHAGYSDSYDTSPGTLVGVLPRQGGAATVSLPAGTAWIRLRIRSQAGIYGPPSPATAVVIDAPVTPLEIDELETDVAELMVSVTDLETSSANVSRGVVGDIVDITALAGAKIAPDGAETFLVWGEWTLPAGRQYVIRWSPARVELHASPDPALADARLRVYVTSEPVADPQTAPAVPDATSILLADQRAPLHSETDVGSSVAVPLRTTVDTLQRVAVAVLPSGADVKVTGVAGYSNLLWIEDVGPRREYGGGTAYA